MSSEMATSAFGHSKSFRGSLRELASSGPVSD